MPTANYHPSDVSAHNTGSAQRKSLDSMSGSAAHTTQQSQALGTRLLSSSGTADQDNAAHTQAHTQLGQQQQQLQHSSMGRPQGTCGPALPERPSGILRQGLVGSSQGGPKEQARESSAPPHAGIIRDIRPAHQACLPSWMHRPPVICCCPSIHVNIATSVQGACVVGATTSCSQCPDSCSCREVSAKMIAKQRLEPLLVYNSGRGSPGRSRASSATPTCLRGQAPAWQGSSHSSSSL